MARLEWQRRPCIKTIKIGSPPHAVSRVWLRVLCVLPTVVGCWLLMDSVISQCLFVVNAVEYGHGAACSLPSFTAARAPHLFVNNLPLPLQFSALDSCGTRRRPLE